MTYKKTQNLSHLPPSPKITQKDIPEKPQKPKANSSKQTLNLKLQGKTEYKKKRKITKNQITYLRK